MAKPFEISEIEKALKAAITEDLVCFFLCLTCVFKIHTNPWFLCEMMPPKERLDKTQDMLTKLVSDEANLDSKTEKKKQELERSQKRLKTVQSVR